MGLRVTVRRDVKGREVRGRGCGALFVVPMDDTSDSLFVTAPAKLLGLCPRAIPRIWNWRGGVAGIGRVR